MIYKIQLKNVKCVVCMLPYLKVTSPTLKAGLLSIIELHTEFKLKI